MLYNSNLHGATIGYIQQSNVRNQPPSRARYKATINRTINHRKHLVQIRDMKVWEECPINALVCNNTLYISPVHLRLALLSKVQEYETSGLIINQIQAWFIAKNPKFS